MGKKVAPGVICVDGILRERGVSNFRVCVVDGNMSTVGPQENPMNEAEGSSLKEDLALGIGLGRKIESPGDEDALDDWKRAENAYPCERDSSY